MKTESPYPVSPHYFRMSGTAVDWTELGRKLHFHDMDEKPKKKKLPPIWPHIEELLKTKEEMTIKEIHQALPQFQFEQIRRSIRNMLNLNVRIERRGPRDNYIFTLKKT